MIKQKKSKQIPFEESLIGTWFRLQKEYEEKYRTKKIALFQQKGSFYECYQYNPNECGETGPIQGCAEKIAEILDFYLTMTDTNIPHSKRNPYMTGGHINKFEDPKKKLLDAGYIVIICDQKLENGKITRDPTEILSPGTVIDQNVSQNVYNVSIVIEIIEKAKRIENNNIFAGIASVDVSTGESLVCELQNKKENPLHVLEEICRLLILLSPKEIQIFINDKKKLVDFSEYKKFLESKLSLNDYNFVDWIDKIDPEYYKPKYQAQFFTKIFENNTISNSRIIDQIGLIHLDQGRLALLLILQYCYAHSERIINKIQKPKIKWLDSEKHLILTYKSALQLDLISGSLNEKNKSLLGLLNQTATPMGFRFLKNSILNPCISSKKLKNRYSAIDELLTKEKMMVSLIDEIAKIADLERLQRKLNLKMIKPHELANLIRYYTNYEKISAMELPETLRKSFEKSKSEFLAHFAEIKTKIKLDILSGAKYFIVASHVDRIIADDNIFTHGTFPELDKIFDEILLNEKKLEEIVTHLNSFLTDKFKALCIETKKKQRTLSDNETSIFTTKKTAEFLLTQKFDKYIVGTNFGSRDYGSKLIIHSSRINDICIRLDNLYNESTKKLYEHFLLFLEDIIKKNDYSVRIAKNIAVLDFLISGAKCAKNYKYFQPRIIENDSGLFDGKNIRHPIIEQLISVPYVANDISLSGALIYGQNSTGKTTLAKAVALNLIMAQIGYYCACELRFSPFHQIITRLSTNDNFVSGLSSYGVEIDEIGTIIKNCDNFSLVVGDELARGTERIGGTSIAASCIAELIDRNSCFIFTSHMHEIPDLLEPEQKNKLHVFHLNCHYDAVLDNMIMDRKLLPGTGETIYGIEFAKFNGLDVKFISRAEKMRKKLLNISEHIINTHKSKYNSEVYMAECFLCKSQNDLHFHHILEQKEADKDGFIGFMHKDFRGNGVILCKTCHIDHHANNRILQMIETLSGRIIK